jgi:hypothetical protein
MKYSSENNKNSEMQWVKQWPMGLSAASHKAQYAKREEGGVFEEMAYIVK